MYNNREYMIVDASQVSAVNFEQVLETSPETLRYSVDRSLTFFKWDNTSNSIPSSIADIPDQYKQGPYTHEEMIEILATPTWSQPMTGFSGFSGN
jgi:hypothetical protein